MNAGRGRREVVLLAAIVLLGGCTGGTGEVVQPSTTGPSASPASPSPTAASSPLPYATPDWFKQGVLYEIFVRSFADSNGDGIGDLRGIADHLDYIRSLGATAIWLTPIFASPSYHGYDTTDYFALNPDFGKRQDLVDLVDAAHQRGMKIVLDFVASHTSNLFPYFEDAYGNPQSKYSDWYIWHDPAHRTYQSFFDIPTLPSLNHANPEVNRYFVDLAKSWMDLDGDGDFTDGVDGFRCDYALGTPHAFWKQLRSELKPLNPNVLLLGEVWVDSPGAQQPYYEDQFDSLFDFPVYLQLQGNPASPGDGVLNGSGFLSSLNNIVREEAGQFPGDAIKVRFAGNHDTDRIATEVDGSASRERLAATLVASLDGTPMIYYGDEIGMAGHKGSGPIYDEYRREPMEWYASDHGPDQPTWFSGSQYDQADDGISVQEEEEKPDSLLSFYRDLFRLRAATPALAEGSFQLLPTDQDSVWAFWRWTGSQVVSAVFNLGTTKVSVALDLSTAPGPVSARPTDLLSGQPVAGRGNPATLTLGPAQASLLDWSPEG